MNENISKKLRYFDHLLGEIEATYHEAAVKLGISDSVRKIIYSIYNNKCSQPLNDICKYTGLSKQTVNSALRKLESDGILHLEHIDGKSKCVYLTDTGKELAEKTVLKLIKIENSIYETWEQSDIDKYLELTERFIYSLKEKIDEL